MDTPLDRLVQELHNAGVSQIAKWLEIFLAYADIKQRVRVQTALITWLRKEGLGK